MGTLMLAGGMGGVAVASQTIGPGLVATFIAVVWMMVALIDLAPGKRPSSLEIAGIRIDFCGVIFLVQGKSWSASTTGLLAIFGAWLIGSNGSVLQKTCLPLAPEPLSCAREILCAGAVLLPISLALGEKFAWLMDALALLSWCYLVVFGSLVRFSTYLFLLANVSPALATSYALMNLVIALLLGVWQGVKEVQKMIDWPVARSFLGC
jgi:drug/metabolite transporter (DMT)-like permease